MPICTRCIKEPFLHRLVEKEGQENQCDYCGNIGQSISIEDLAARLETAFEVHYERTSVDPEDWEIPLLSDKESDYEWVREGESSVDAIMNAADIPEAAAQDVQKILADENLDYESAEYGDEQEFSDDTYYRKCEPNSSKWYEEWDHFKVKLKYEARFFSREAVSKLSELFDTLDTMRTLQGQSLIIDAGPGTNHTHFYRARVFQSDDKLKLCMMQPDKELSAPPSYFAGAGRMNARGISVFYGATSISTALAEVRPPVGSKVAVAQFELIRTIKLLDLSALAEVHESGSIFDPEYAYRLGRKGFLQQLTQHMTQPVMPDAEEFEYLITQAIADFLATEGKVLLDGILYPSVQVAGDGINVVLFHKAARCKELEFPPGIELKVDVYTHYSEGTETDYHVTESVPDELRDPNEDISLSPFERGDFQELDLPDNDRREETLSIDLKSMAVHHVNAVKIDTEAFFVRRLRFNFGGK